MLHACRNTGQRPFTFITIKQDCILLYTLTHKILMYNEHFLSSILCRDSILIAWNDELLFNESRKNQNMWFTAMV